SGKTIAPRNEGDVEATFNAAGLPCPDLSLIYAVATALRSLHNTLGRFVKAISSGGGDEAIEKLRTVIGSAADEVVDEFVIATVTEVGEPRRVPKGLAGRLR
ncbi:MAG TPA: hypothetical protein VF728_00160, partial [Nocardioides sp.]